MLELSTQAADGRDIDGRIEAVGETQCHEIGQGPEGLQKVELPRRVFGQVHVLVLQVRYCLTKVRRYQALMETERKGKISLATQAN